MAGSEASGVPPRFCRSGSGLRNIILVHELGGSLDGWGAVVPNRAIEPFIRACSPSKAAGG